MSLIWAMSNEEYRDVAKWAGYDDPRLYALEHDVTHHALAHHLRWTWSRALHDGDPTKPLDEADEVIRWEEHVVNRLQRYARTGLLDEFGVIHHLFPDIENAAVALRRIWNANDAAFEEQGRVGDGSGGSTPPRLPAPVEGGAEGRSAEPRDRGGEGTPRGAREGDRAGGEGQ